MFFGRRLRGERRSPLWLYGVLELCIGLYALAFPLLFGLLETVYGAAYPLLAGSGAGLFGLRFILLFALFLVPTFFMGGTLPLLLDGLIAGDRSIGSRTSLLYGINILGATAGVLGIKGGPEGPSCSRATEHAAHTDPAASKPRAQVGFASFMGFDP